MGERRANPATIACRCRKDNLCSWWRRKERCMQKILPRFSTTNLIWSGPSRHRYLVVARSFSLVEQLRTALPTPANPGFSAKKYIFVYSNPPRINCFSTRDFVLVCTSLALC